jgi:hypothetical protein
MKYKVIDKFYFQNYGNFERYDIEIYRYSNDNKLYINIQAESNERAMFIAYDYILGSEIIHKSFSTVKKVVRDITFSVKDKYYVQELNLIIIPSIQFEQKRKSIMTKLTINDKIKELDMELIQKKKSKIIDKEVDRISRELKDWELEKMILLENKQYFKLLIKCIKNTFTKRFQIRIK